MSVDLKIKIETIFSFKLYYLLAIFVIFNNFQSIHSFPHIDIAAFLHPHATELPEISANVLPKHRYSQLTCGESKFSCGDSCIPLVWKCDGAPDCKDGSDETGCNLCGEYEFECANGQCIPRDLLCDSEDDCGDKSDEVNCKVSCPPCSMFTCSIGDKCIDKAKKCNGITDCPDGSDEEDCCSDKEFRCDNGTCINKIYHCDQYFDCFDQSDEIGCDTKIHRKETKQERPESSVDFMNIFNFLANFGAYSTIERVNTKNGSKMEIVLKANSVSTIGVAISAENVKVYWINGTHGTLVNSNGLDKEKL